MATPNASSPPAARGPLPGVLRRFLALPWTDLGTASAVVIVGFSQIVFAILLENLDYFPREIGFHAGVVFWAGLLPFGALAGLHLGIARLTRRGPVFEAWRAFLITLLFAALLRQAQVYYPAPFRWFYARIPPQAPFAGLLLLVLLLSYRCRAALSRFAAMLGLLGALLTASYASRCGLLGDLWRSPRLPEAVGNAPWKGDPAYVLVFDELSWDVLLKDGRIDAEAFPNFAALAAASTLFTNAVTNHVFTVDAFRSLLGGRLDPGENGAKLFDYLPADCRVLVRDYFNPTYAWMRRHSRPGRQFILRGEAEAVPGGFLEAPGIVADLLAQTPFSRSPFDHAPATRILPPLVERVPDERFTVETEIAGFLDGLADAGGKGRLHLWHSPLPHFPFRFNPDGSRHGEVSSEFLLPYDLKKLGNPADYRIDRVLYNYRRQAGYADHVLGLFLRRLKDLGIGDEAVIAVTSDHGLRTWGTTEPRDYPARIGGEVARIPLLIRSPRFKPGPNSREYQHLDFVPTLLDALGISYDPAGFEGRSAFAPDPGPRRRILHDLHCVPFSYDAAADLWLPLPAR